MKIKREPVLEAVVRLLIARIHEEHSTQSKWQGCELEPCSAVFAILVTHSLEEVPHAALPHPHAG